MSEHTREIERDRILLKGLKAVRRRRFDPKGGICWNLDIWQQNQRAHSEEPSVSTRIWLWAERWPKFSGSVLYPVPSPDPNAFPSHAFAFAMDANGRMWGRKSAYGKLRWELLEFIISELEKHLAVDARQSEV